MKKSPGDPPCSDESGCGFTPPRSPDSAQHCRRIGIGQMLSQPAPGDALVLFGEVRVGAAAEEASQEAEQVVSTG
jgi:hypothetical protein